MTLSVWQTSPEIWWRIDTLQCGFTFAHSLSFSAQLERNCARSKHLCHSCCIFCLDRIWRRCQWRWCVWVNTSRQQQVRRKLPRRNQLQSSHASHAFQSFERPVKNGTRPFTWPTAITKRTLLEYICAGVWRRDDYLRGVFCLFRLGPDFGTT